MESERLSKLSLEGRRIILSDPDTLIEGWEDSAFSYPELSQINVEKYWDESEFSIVITMGWQAYTTPIHAFQPVESLARTSISFKDLPLLYETVGGS